MSLESLVAWYSSLPLWVIISVVVWDGVWKALAMWKSARLSEPIWFIVLFVINSLGILPILYLFIFSKQSKNANKVQKASRRSSRKRS